ncbi:poly-beta-1,6-N-acetyl-D-glucosamine N-deacetylase PgaB [Acinetobacter terrae]|uniref:Poly-beta-1,6-N-acetyl-D-glucosamine N-deacetylase PgaB n=1 Tax=Acinetobacter terrae TaxID=2731247 RepID=A0A8E4FDT5_9GAMM|nr:poly-beta-1,6-N-acetyl-D-glucosamine N-deacetylase PgaB [Acinetobacter terrae]NNH39714.1 poly-beta-1,6-N-acetyl-D-glucosamine N-deacetylase PgaB [Acinetobacter terrae]NNH87189.1 poly-beta-1,6-N-acetyl-D-glucosamine N-deacetylase PgaB [Acinetobacter terrae]
MNTRLLSTLLSTSLFAALWQIPHLAWSQTPAHNPTLTVIGYHEIINTENALIPEYAVSTTQFQQHIDWLKKNGFHFINVDQLIQAHQGKYSLPKKPVLLTVDDGYASFYQNAYPIVKANKIPVVLAVVGSWLEPKEDQSIDFSGEQLQRNQMLSWAELKEMQDSGLVEMASHSYNLHRGIVGNPQGNFEPAAVTRLYDPKSASYEDDSHYQQRISNDLKQNNQLLIAHGLKSPRVMVWPYGHYNMQTVKIAKQLGMPVAISLDDGADSAKSSLGQLNRILIEGNMTTTDLAQEIQNRQQHLGDNNRPQKIMHIDLDYIYDKDPIQQERNLDHLLDRIVAMKVNTVYLQAFSDPDANGSADMVYFPNHYLPMRADLFNRVAWQIQTRTQVGRVYAWMPLLAWELPKNNPVSNDVVETQQTEDSEHLNMGYRRLSPFSPDARKTISGIYQDLAKSVPFNGILFHDDTTLSDYEDASPEALKAYAAIGLPTDLAKIRSNDADLQKWTAYKTKYIDDFALQLAQQVRQYHPFLLTARNLYAQVALKPYAENWYSQSLEQSINRYDFTAIMAMPYMEQAPNSDAFYRDIVNRVKQFPKGIKKTVFELQAVNWRTNQKVPSDEMAQTIQSLYEQGAMHVAYYPDDPIQDHPDTRVLRKAFDLKSSKLVP